ncbi:MAG: DUF547 domain-containing protein [Acidimicrobiia bacterium]
MRRKHPDPRGTGTVDHDALSPILDDLRTRGVPALPELRTELSAYRKQLEDVDPDDLNRDEALALWLNLYNAGALDLAADTYDQAEGTVLRVPGAFSRKWATVAGEALSLEEIEHAKIRRFRDPRFHAALVCGSASCPTLRYEPYRGPTVHAQLGDQMSNFLRHGGAHVDRAAGVLSLSRIFLWYGADFARPHRMPTWLPTTKRSVVKAIRTWLDPQVVRWLDEEQPAITWQTYDWSLACAVR